MYYVERRSFSILEVLPIIFGVLIGLIIILLIVNNILKNQDSKKNFKV